MTTVAPPKTEDPWAALRPILERLPPTTTPDAFAAAIEELMPLPPEEWPPVDHLVTEDDTPVDNFASAKQQRLLVESLYASWSGPGEGRPFLADTNIGLYYRVNQEPLVPDVFLSLDVQVAKDWWAKGNRAYLVWVFGKPPDLVIEVVSNRKGEETGRKWREYRRAGIPYYVIFDPLQQMQPEPLRAYELRAGEYTPISAEWLPLVGLGLRAWRGSYEGREDLWLRWCDHEGQLLLTGAESAEREHRRAEQERRRAEQERRRAERLAEQLRALGVELPPD